MQSTYVSHLLVICKSQPTVVTVVVGPSSVAGRPHYREKDSGGNGTAGKVGNAVTAAAVAADVGDDDAGRAPNGLDRAAALVGEVRLCVLLRLPHWLHRPLQHLRPRP